MEMNAFYSVNINKKSLGDLGIDGKMIFKYLLKKRCMRTCTGFISLRIFSSNEGSYKCRKEPTGP
jgi:hypothetical protein